MHSKVRENAVNSKKKMAETRKEGQTKVLAEKNHTSVAKGNETSINAEKSQASSISENQTIVTYTDDELVSFKVKMVSKKKTGKKYKYIRTPFAVLVQRKTWQIS